MTASGCGRDDLPETVESLPSHSPGENLAGRLRATGQGKRTAGRLTKPPRGGRWRACPLADAKAACFVSAHRDPEMPSGMKETIGTQATFGHVGNRHRTKSLRAGGTDRRDTGSSDRGPARQEAAPSGKRTATGSEGTSVPEAVGQDRASAWELRTRCGPRASAHGHAKAEPRLRPRIQPDAISRASVHENGNGREAEREFQIRRAANRQGFGPDGEPAGKPSGLRPGRTP